MDNNFNTPILFLIFNRPEQTRMVFEAIKKKQPSKLYISADGPRMHSASDQEKCNETRKIIDEVDWKCELKIKFNDVNLGCKIAVSSGISWFFQNEEEGIIIEDDCLPSDSFFSYCSELLNIYRFDTRIGSITGYNYLNMFDSPSSYFFSNISSIWGWASWRRVWEKYDVNMKDWISSVNQKAVDKVLYNKILSLYFKYKFNLTYQNKIDTWDYQFLFLNLINNWLTIVPSKSLIKNIGFGADAVHTGKITNLSTNNYEIEPNLIHPQFYFPNRKYDFKYIQKYINLSSFKNLIKNSFNPMFL